MNPTRHSQTHSLRRNRQHSQACQGAPCVTRCASQNEARRRTHPLGEHTATGRGGHADAGAVWGYSSVCTATPPHRQRTSAPTPPAQPKRAQCRTSCKIRYNPNHHEGRLHQRWGRVGCRNSSLRRTTCKRSKSVTNDSAQEDERQSAATKVRRATRRCDVAYPHAGWDVQSEQSEYWPQQSTPSHAQPVCEQVPSTEPPLEPSLQRDSRTHHPAKHMGEGNSPPRIAGPPRTA